MPLHMEVVQPKPFGGHAGKAQPKPERGRPQPRCFWGFGQRCAEQQEHRRIEKPVAGVFGE